MTAGEIAELVGADATAHAGHEVRRVSGFDGATGDAVVFALDAVALDAAMMTTAGVILAKLDTVADDDRVMRVRDPKFAFALCGKALTRVETEALMHPSASVHASARVGTGTSIGAGAVIEANVVVGEHGSIGSHVTLCRGAQLGNRVVIQPGAVIGATGFGYVRDATTGEHLLFPQQGACVLEDDVEVGANTTIDRGALGETRIGRGTKIDNQVHIGHNCSIGRNVLIAAQVGISGSCVIEDDAVLAGQVGLGDHVAIGRGVILGGSAGVFPHKHLEGAGQMFMGVPAEPLKDYLKSLARVRRLK